MLNVIPGSVSGRRYVNQPRWCKAILEGLDDSCVPGIPNFVDYNYKSATLMLMSLSSQTLLSAGLAGEASARESSRESKREIAHVCV